MSAGLDMMYTCCVAFVCHIFYHKIFGLRRIQNTEQHQKNLTSLLMSLRLLDNIVSGQAAFQLTPRFLLEGLFAA